MITKNEISSLNLSPTKKDFVQIWNELMEVASKITERWDPTSTNESDPGIVLLKVLTGIADKLNYNIDKNILEAYMPTAAQMESMRKLCELMGYNIKYYQSAETKVKISYTGNTTDLTDANEEKLPPLGLRIPKFTTITNADKDITFVTTNIVPLYITNSLPWVEVPCIEGQISQCESINEHNLITLSQLDDNNRYYLPEIQIAENGIFVYNAAVVNDEYFDGTPWEQVSNLNTRSTETRVFKFGYDSFEGRPYLAFPDDIGSLIGDGLFIYFIRTSGLNGNISPRTLEVLEVPTGGDWDNYSAEQFEVVNVDATTNGANIESISAAYNNFKKTVGTFDTLVTCRDYMNKIYSLMDASNYPYVSNILVTDIRNDINNAITLCSCNEFGILYKETPITRKDIATSTITTTELNTIREVREFITDGEKVKRLFIENKPTETVIKTETDVDIPLIDHFDLILYPFKTFTQVSSGTQDLITPYNKSFTYAGTEQLLNEIDASLADFKTCAHKLVLPADWAVVSINNYLRLNALIATSNKVSEPEAKSILQNVKVALVNEFNMRNLDFGEEIPFDSILSVIENADSRIKVVSLQEPTVLTTYSVKEPSENGEPVSKEYGIASTVDTVTGQKIMVKGAKYGVGSEEDPEINSIKAKEIYNKLVLRNILAGRASLFSYDETFIANNSEKPYTITEKLVNHNIDLSAYDKVGELVLTERGPNNGVLTLKISEPATTENESSPDVLPDLAKVKEVYETYTPFENDTVENITRVEAVCEISSESNTFKNIKLGKNEVIKFRAPNLITTQTFPAYVYYRFEKKGQSDGSSSTSTNSGSYATVNTLTSFIMDNDIGVELFFTTLWNDAGNGLKTFKAKFNSNKPSIPQDQLTTIFNTAIAVGTEDNTKFFTSRPDLETYIEGLSNSGNTNEVTFKYYPLNNGTMSIWSNCVRKLREQKGMPKLPDGTTLWRLSSTTSYPKGKFVTEEGQRIFAQSGEYLANNRVGDITYICTDLGADPDYYVMSENSDIELQEGDKLYIHYTPSSTNEDGETEKAEPVSLVYEGSQDNPIILKPSGFTLTPSEDVHRQGTSWKKTDVDFGGSHGTKNLLALAPNEQIEMRSISRVVLDKPARFYKNFSEPSLEQINVNKVTNYELKDGEYIFYTDQSGQEAAYYGSGSVITLEGGANIPRATESVEVSQILEQGLHIVPWSDIKLLNDSRKITITEYQYVTLVAGDTLDTLTVKETESDSSGAYIINNKQWLSCDSDNPITYTASGAESSTTLPTISLISSTSRTWEVCSFLELSTSPGYSQQLRAGETSFELSGENKQVSITDKINIYTSTGTSETPTATIQPQVTASPETLIDTVSIKLSTIAQTASGKFVPATDSSSSANIQMKIFKEEPPSKIELNSLDDITTPISDKHSVPVETTTNINNYWSRIDIGSELWRAYTSVDNETMEYKPNALNLNFMIPNTDVFGIFSIYLEVPEDRLAADSKQPFPAEGSKVFIDIPKEFNPNTLSIFNYSGSNGESWWSEGIDTSNPSRLYLRAGLNCIKITSSCNILIKAQENAYGNILYDNLRLVKGIETNGINLKLLDPNATFNLESLNTNKTEIEKVEEQKKLSKDVLSQIAKLDKNHEFYYNVPIENSLAIEFDDNINAFSSPYTLYDINNVNNSFVISKLDVAYLDDGIKIAKSSRSQGVDYL